MTLAPHVEILTPRDREAWLRVRGKDITASNVGALFGEHEFMTPYALWAIKTGRIPRDSSENDAMRRGRLLESVAVQILREDHPDWQITHNASENTYYRSAVYRLGATPDVIVECPRRGRGIVQIKSVEAGTYRRKWMAAGPEEPPEPPFWIVLQAVLEAWLVGAKWACVAPLVIGHGIEMPLIEIPLDHMEGVIDAMIERTSEFWAMVDQNREPPPDFGRDAGTIDAIYQVGDPNEAVDLTGDDEILGLIEKAHAARDQMLQGEAALTRYQAEIKAMLGVAEVAYIAGGRTITWKTHRRIDPKTGRAGVYRRLSLPRN